MAKNKPKDDSKASAGTEPAAAPQVVPAVTDAPPEKTVDGGAGNAASSAAGGESLTVAFPPSIDLPAGALKGAQLLVTAKSERGRRRAGYAFTRAVTELPFGELNTDQLAALAADPELTVALRLVKPA